MKIHNLKIVKNVIGSANNFHKKAYIDAGTELSRIFLF